MTIERWPPYAEGVQYPAMRNEIVGALEALSDEDYQQKMWVEGQYPDPSFYHDFDMAVHTLYDDTGVGDGPRSQIGSTLRDETEAQLIQDLLDALDPVLDQCDDRTTFEEIRNIDRWPDVVSTAAAALARMRTPPS